MRTPMEYLCRMIKLDIYYSINNNFIVCLVFSNFVVLKHCSILSFHLQWFQTTMYSHRSKVSRSTKFTTHAAVQLQRRHNNSTSNHYDSTATGQLLEDLNHKDSIQLKRLVHETFPTVSTTTTDHNHQNISVYRVVILVMGTYTCNLLNIKI